LSPATAVAPKSKKDSLVRGPLSRGQAIGIVFVCTLLGAAGQVLIKTGAAALGGSASPVAMITNPHLLGGYLLYGLMTMLFVVALKDEQLSILYPIIALTYVWVALLSVVIFSEVITPFKLAGLGAIVAGVAVLGTDRKR
jgi:multidrug transporter EmrE-like cation transporter